MIRMMEEEIYLFCLEKDKNMVNSVLKTAEKKFSETVKEQLGTGKYPKNYIFFNQKICSVN